MFKFKESCILSSIMLSVAMMIIFISVAEASTLDVSRVKQAKTKWCWAATSEMIGNYMNSSSDRTQWDIVGEIKGMDYPNVGGRTTDIKDGIKYASEDTVTYSSGSTVSWSTHASNIDDGNPLGVWMNWNSGGAHALVCAGAKVSSGNNYLYIIDPWEDNTSSWYRYDCLKNGTTIQSGTGSYDTSFWKR